MSYDVRSHADSLARMVQPLSGYSTTLFHVQAALERAYAAGLEAGRAEQARKLAAWEPVVRVCRETPMDDAALKVLGKIDAALAAGEYEREGRR